MFEFQTKIKRQMEILGLCIQNSNEIFKTFDLAELFNVEELTIKRDLQELRNYGVDIHSSKKKGVSITSPIDKSKIAECILYYTGLNRPTLLSERSTLLLVENRGDIALKNIVLLQLGIDNKLSVKIIYNKEGNDTSEKIVDPILIYENEGHWRLLVQDKGKIKQYLINKIENVELTKGKFERISEEKFESLFQLSWKSWLGDDKYDVKLLLSKFWSDKISPTVLVPNQKLIRQKDGSVIYEVTVNSLNEIAGWIVSRGKGIKVIEPEELKKQVISLAKETLENYK